MKAKNIKTLSIIVFGILLTAQFIFLLLPGWLLMPYNRVCQPLIYGSIVAALFAIMGRDMRPIPKAAQAALLSGICVILYFFAMLIAAVIFGYGKNVMVPNVSASIDNLWVYGTVVFMAELLRFKLVRSTPAGSRSKTAIVLSIVYTFNQLDSLKGFIKNPANIVEFFFVHIFPTLVLNGVLSYIAFEGSLKAVLLLRGTYSLCPVLMPFLPSAPRVVWALTICTLLFVTVIMYHRNMSDRSSKARQIAKRRAKYTKAYLSPYIIYTFFILLTVAFGLRFFTYFPAVAVTGSMTGAIDRGSIVFIEKLKPEKIFASVNEGDIIHFRYKKIEVIHRVIEFRYNEKGERLYVTKGDANLEADRNPVEANQIIGIARNCIPYVGYPFIIVRAFRNS